MADAQTVPARAPALGWVDEALAALEARGLTRTIRTFRAASAVEAELSGKRIHLFSTNDYLGLSSHPSVVAAVREFVAARPGAPRAAPLVCGHTDAHEALEAALARWKRTEAALLFPSGYQAAVSVIPALVSEGDCVFSDERNHASLVDGCRLSKAERRVYRHLDATHLETLLASSDARRRLVVTESYFGMDGDTAPLREISAVARRFGAMLMLDEAHANLVFGETGAGLAEEHAVLDEVHVHMGTLSKAFGAAGGFVAVPSRLRTHLLATARGYLFSTALPPVVAHAALAALRTATAEPGLRARLWASAARLAGRLSGAAGLAAGPPRSPILPVVLRDPARTMRAQAALLEAGYHVAAARPPTVAEGTSRLRVSVSAAHDPEVVDRFADALAAVLRTA